MTRSLKNKIDYLHSKVGAKEWSGELITREKGCINDLDAWEITAEDMFLADIGTAGGTEYEVGRGPFKGSDIIELYEKFPELEEGKLKLHHIHTHHSMNSFFSGTDWENLETRSLVSNYFLMLIVNFAGNFIAKVAFKAKRDGIKKTKLSFANNIDGLKPITLGSEKDEEILVIMDCKVEVDENITVEKEFEDRYKSVVKAKEEEEKNRIEALSKQYPPYAARDYTNYGKGSGARQGTIFPPAIVDDDPYAYTREGGWRDEFEFKEGIWKKKEKKISEMTDKEFEKFEQEEMAQKVFEHDQAMNKRFDMSHAREILNSVIDGTYSGGNYGDVMGSINRLNTKMKSYVEVEEWIDGFQNDLQDHFDVIHYKCTIEQYVELMETVATYLEPYKYIRLVQEMLIAVRDEIEMCYDVSKSII